VALLWGIYAFVFGVLLLFTFFRFLFRENGIDCLLVCFFVFIILIGLLPRLLPKKRETFVAKDHPLCGIAGLHNPRSHKGGSHGTIFPKTPAFVQE
jgi:hypothetical protein